LEHVNRKTFFTFLQWNTETAQPQLSEQQSPKNGKCYQFPYSKPARYLLVLLDDTKSCISCSYEHWGIGNRRNTWDTDVSSR